MWKPARLVPKLYELPGSKKKGKKKGKKGKKGKTRKPIKGMEFRRKNVKHIFCC